MAKRRVQDAAFMARLPEAAMLREWLPVVRGSTVPEAAARLMMGMTVVYMGRCSCDPWACMDHGHFSIIGGGWIICCCALPPFSWRLPCP